MITSLSRPKRSSSGFGFQPLRPIRPVRGDRGRAATTVPHRFHYRWCRARRRGPLPRNRFYRECDAPSARGWPRRRCARPERDLTPLPDLVHGRRRIGPVRERRPVYVDLLPAANASILAARMPRAQIHRVHGGGHLCLLDRAAEVGPVVSAFLGSLERWCSISRSRWLETQIAGADRDCCGVHLRAPWGRNFRRRRGQNNCEKCQLHCDRTSQNTLLHNMIRIRRLLR